VSHIDLQNIYSVSAKLDAVYSLVQFLSRRARHLVHLRSLSVHLGITTAHVSIQFLALALQQIPSLHRIFIESIPLPTTSADLDPLMLYIFREKSTINNCSLRLDRLNCDIKISNWFINPNLKHLNITRVSWKQLVSILTFTPQLHVLKATINPYGIVPQDISTLYQLRKIDLSFRNLSFAPLLILKQAAPNLQCLHLKGYFDANDTDYLNDKLLHTLIHNVKHFNVELSALSSDDTRNQIIKRLIRDCQEKEWFKIEENEKFLTVCVIIKSLTV
jgi:hypothetical protein